MKKKSSARKKTPPSPRTTGAQRNAVPLGYGQLLDELKTRVRAAQLKAAVAANRELIRLYWDIGRMIVERQQQEGWGASVIDRLAADLLKAFPGLKGFSVSNVSRMRTFYRAYRPAWKELSQAVIELAAPISAQPVPKLKGKSSAQPVPKSRGRKVPQLVRYREPIELPEPLGEIPWGHNVLLLFKLNDCAERLWYAEQTAAHGWSRAVLTVQIETDLYGRQGKAITNFAKTLPAPRAMIFHVLCAANTLHLYRLGVNSCDFRYYPLACWPLPRYAR